MGSLKRRTSVPSLPEVLLERTRLISRIQSAITPSSPRSSAACNLLLVCAPAGYGKTTLLVDFARHTQIPWGWFTLDSAACDPTIFLETLTTIVSDACPAFKQALPDHLLPDLLIALQSDDKRAFETCIDDYTNLIDISLPGPLIIALCNYHETIQKPLIQQFLNALLHRMPHHLTLIIESRAVPPLDLTLLVARGQMLGIGSNALRFTNQDVYELSHLIHANPLSSEQANQLATKFDGWITGILLTTQLGWSIGTPSLDDEFDQWGASAWQIEQQALLQYLLNDVFHGNSAEFQFLRDLSLLDTIDEDIANALLGGRAASERLRHIEQQGLFLLRVKSKKNQLTYACHPTVRELFYQHLCQYDPDRAAFLHRQAATFYLAADHAEQAISHALAAQEYQMMIDILINMTDRQSYTQLPPESLIQWIDALPTELQNQYPEVLLLRALVNISQYDYAQAQPVLERTLSLLSPTHLDGRFPTFYPMLLLAQSVVIFQQGEYDKTQQLCQEALTQLAMDEIQLRTQASIRLGICETLLGNCMGGIESFQQALHLNGNLASTQQTAYIHSCLANGYSLLCNYELSKHHRARAITLYEQLGDERGKLNNLIWTAMLQRDQGILDEAETLLQEVLTQATSLQHHQTQAYALFNQGAIFLDKAQYTQALISLEKALTLARTLGDNRLSDQSLCSMAAAYLFLNDVATARLYLTKTTITESGKGNYEALEHDLVHGAILLHQKHITEAIECFRHIETFTLTAGMKQAQVVCQLRLAACYCALEDWPEMEMIMMQVVGIVKQGYFEHIALLELQQNPKLWAALQSLPETICPPAWRTSSLPSSNLTHDTHRSQSHAPTIMASDTQSHIRIQALGEPSVIMNDATITHWRMARTMELFFFLLDYGRPIRKDQILTLFWPTDEGNADQTLRSTMHYLRKIIGDNSLVYQSGMYTLNLKHHNDDSIWYDISVFQHHSKQAKQALEQEQDEVAQRHLLDMVELYHGDYVQAFYSDWCISRRDELRQLYMDARQNLALLAWNADHVDESIMHWQQMLALDPCFEKAHYGVMRCYVHQRQRELAIRQYQKCVDALQQELGIAPGPSIQKYYQKIRQG